MIQTKHKFLYKACDANCACKRKSMKSEFTKRERTKLGVLVCSAAIVFCFPPPPSSFFLTRSVVANRLPLCPCTPPGILFPPATPPRSDQFGSSFQAASETPTSSPDLPSPLPYSPL